MLWYKSNFTPDLMFRDLHRISISTFTGTYTSISLATMR